jgi:hypothetical protein
MDDSSLYILQDVPGKGKGLVARKNISKGTRILSEQPVITTPERQLSVTLLKSHISQQVDSLTEDQRRSFLSMHNLYPFENTAEQNLGIIRTNSLPIEAGGIGGGIFLEACRINHSCDNNTQKNWNKRIEKHTVYALRDIPEGEEITVYYLGLDASRKIRQQRLQDKFGFLCSCRMCSLNTAESEKSDRRLKRIDLLDDLIGKQGMAENFSQGMLRHVDELVQLYNKQGPGDAGLSRAYIDAAQVAIANGDLARGRAFAEMAVEVYRTAHGSDSDEVLQYTPMAQNPASHPIFGISKHWTTSPGEVSLQPDSDGYEDWLWRREPRNMPPQLGEITSLRNREIFPSFSDLSESNMSFYSYSEETEEPGRHWCFLGEITGSATMHHLELEMKDVDEKSLPLHFNTDSLGRELRGDQIRTGYTVAVLYAKRHRFTFGDPGIKHVNPELLKVCRLISQIGIFSGVLTSSAITQVFPISLAKLLELSDRVQQFSSEEDGVRTCHGCSKKAASLNRCGKCALFWYCDNVRPRSLTILEIRLTSPC